MENYKDIYTSIIVLGASGDLARKKTYPALFELYVHNILPKHFLIMGYARSIKTNGEFQNYLKLNLLKSYPTKESDIDYFIRNCFYSYGGYDSIDDVHAMNKIVLEKEELHYNNRIQDFQEIQETLNDPQSSPSSSNVANRIFYFAIPPNVFIPIAKTIANTGFMKTTNGKNSFIIEKPFGFDYDSCFTLQTELNKLFDEDAIYRIDHYLGMFMCIYVK